jgi:hypothetical protein
VLDEMTTAARFLLDAVWLFVEPLFWSALAFALIALALKGRGALEAAHAPPAKHESPCLSRHRPAAGGPTTCPGGWDHRSDGRSLRPCCDA